MRFLVRALGWVMIGFGALGAAVEIDSACKGKGEDPAVGIVIIAIFGGGGLLLVRAGKRMKGGGATGAASASSIEERVLAAARRLRGHVTAVSAAADGGVTVEQARAELERLAKENACLMDVSSDGLVVFRFPEFEIAEGKPSA
jgi:hypothetical protein